MPILENASIPQSLQRKSCLPAQRTALALKFPKISPIPFPENTPFVGAAY